MEIHIIGNLLQSIFGEVIPAIVNAISYIVTKFQKKKIEPKIEVQTLTGKQAGMVLQQQLETSAADIHGHKDDISDSPVP
jgi:hypothetical protein